MLGTFEEEFSKIEEEYRQRLQDDLLVALSDPDARAVIFGAGAVGTHVMYGLKACSGREGTKIVAFCDNFKTGINSAFNIPIVSPAELIKHYKDAVIIVAVNHTVSDEIYNQVLEIGFPQEKVFRRYSCYMMEIDDLHKHLDGYKWAYEFFEDTISKTIILNRMRGYLFNFEMEHAPREETYFEKEVIQFSEHEVFIDGGCYNGETALEFIRRMNGRYDFIYSFEPVTEYFEIAKSNLVPHKNIEIINKGLWSKADKLFFHVEGEGSRISTIGDNFISVTSLDEFFMEGKEKHLPTFIKLDIEGAEKNALLGMKKIIEKVHPKFAVCVYHKPEDIYELPQLLMELGKGRYKFMLRHYAVGLFETVLYAI